MSVLLNVLLLHCYSCFVWCGGHTFISGAVMKKYINKSRVSLLFAFLKNKRKIKASFRMETELKRKVFYSRWNHHEKLGFQAHWELFKNNHSDLKTMLRFTVQKCDNFQYFHHIAVCHVCVIVRLEDLLLRK